MIKLPEGVLLDNYRNADLNKPEEAQALLTKILNLWSEMADQPQLFGDDGLRDPRKFGQWITAPDTVVLKTPFGYVFVVRIVPDMRAEVHLYIKDHKLSAHADLLKECLIWGFLTFNLTRVETFLPSHAFTVKRFLVDRMGFKYEGRMRSRVKLQGQFIDTEIFSILREEVL